MLRGARWATAMSLLFTAGLAGAQTYRCTGPSGAYYTDRACPAGASSIGGATAGAAPPTSLGSVGPVDSDTPWRPSTRVRPSMPGQPAEHVKYLGSECMGIQEAIRTAPSRGVGHEHQQGLRDEFQRKCGVEDELARRRAWADQREAEDSKRAEMRRAEEQRKQASQLQARCAGMLDVIALRRKRQAEMNAKELDALRELERSYNERCLKA